MRIRSFVTAAAALAGAVFMLAGCVVVEEGPVYRPSPSTPSRPGPAACSREYAPVCGERRGDRQTFPNACTARADGYRISHAGACRGGGGNSGAIGGGGGGGAWGGSGGGGNWNNRPVHSRPSRPSQPQACTREYAPVCARSGRDTRTFPNACEARSANFRVIGSGRC